MVAASQVLAFGFHFSPLAALPLVACGLWLLVSPKGRDLLRTPAPWIALVCVVVHIFPIVHSALDVAQALPSARTPYTFFERLQRYVLVSLDMLTGEATIRHFTAVSWRGTALVLQRIAFLALTIAALLSGKRSDTGGFASALPPFGLLYFLLSIVALPLILSVGREWSFPWIDQERYGFALLAPFIMLAGGLSVHNCLARSRAHNKWVLTAIVAMFAVVPSARLLWASNHSGGPDQGLFWNTGGGWRGWRAAIGPQAVPDAILANIEHIGAEEPVTLIATDWFGMRAIDFPLTVRGDDGIRLAWAEIDQSGGIRMPRLQPSSLAALIVWSDEMFGPDFQPPEIPVFNHDARHVFRQVFRNVRLVRTIVQPDGSPLLEVWAGRAPY